MTTGPVLVTGAAGTIGTAIAAEFEATGRRVIRHDFRAGDGVDMVGDLASSRHQSELGAALEQTGVGTVVAAHGIAGSVRVGEATGPFIDRTLKVNTQSVFDLFGTVREQLSARDGVFVALSSQAGLVGEAGNAIYCASKFALIGWAQEVSALSGSPRIRVLCPGMVQSALLLNAFEQNGRDRGMTYEEVLTERLLKVPNGRLARPGEVARASRWLAELSTVACVVAPVTGGEILA